MDTLFNTGLINLHSMNKFPCLITKVTSDLSFLLLEGSDKKKNSTQF